MDSLTDLYRAPARHDARRARRALPAAGRVDPPGGGLFIWATLPDFIDTTDLLARALRENVAFVPARRPSSTAAAAARCASTSPARDEDDDPRGHPPDRRGGDRAGRAVRHAHRASGRRRPSAGAGGRAPTCVPTADAGGAGAGAPSASEPRVAVLKGGRSLERQVSLRSGARVEDALERLGHEVVAIDVGARPDPAAARRRARRGVRRACTAATARTARSRSCSRSLGVPYTGSGVLACVRAMDKVLAKHLMLEAGIPTPEFFAFNETAFRELGAAEALPAIEERLGFPIVVKPVERRARRSGSSSPRSAADVPGGAGRGVLATTRRCCSSATSTGATWRCRSWTARRCRSSRPCRRSEEFYDFEARYEIGRTDVRVPGRAARRRGRRARTGARAAHLPAARLPRLRPRGPDAGRAGDARPVLEANTDPGPHRDEPAAPGRRGGGHVVRRAGRADPGAGAAARPQA